jgi:hypothetical protein
MFVVRRLSRRDVARFPPDIEDVVTRGVFVVETSSVFDVLLAVRRYFDEERARFYGHPNDEGTLWIDRSIGLRYLYPARLEISSFADDSNRFDRHTSVLTEIVRAFSSNVGFVRLVGEFDVAVDLTPLRTERDGVVLYEGQRPPLEISLYRIASVIMTIRSSDDVEGRRTCVVRDVMAERIDDFIVRCACDEVVLLPMVQNVRSIGTFRAISFGRCDAEAIVSAPQCGDVGLPASVVVSNVEVVRAALDRVDDGKLVALNVTGAVAAPGVWELLRGRITRLKVVPSVEGAGLSIVRAGRERTLTVYAQWYALTTVFADRSAWTNLASITFDAAIHPHAMVPDALDRTYDVRGFPALRRMEITRVQFPRDAPPSTYFALPPTLRTLMTDDSRFGNVPPFPRVLGLDGDEHPGRAIQAFLTVVDTSPALTRFRAKDPRPYLLYVMRLLTDDDYMRVVFGERWEDSIVATARLRRT